MPEFGPIEMMRFARYSVSVVVMTLVAFIAAWAGCRFYLQRQVTLLVADLRSLDAAHDPNGQAKILVEKYGSHFIDRRCVEDYCPDRFLFTNRILSTFTLLRGLKSKLHSSGLEALCGTSIRATLQQFSEKTVLLWRFQRCSVPMRFLVCATTLL